jgi:hypothetical protein
MESISDGQTDKRTVRTEGTYGADGTDRHKEEQTRKQTDGQTAKDRRDGQDRKTDKQTNRPTVRQNYRRTNTEETDRTEETIRQMELYYCIKLSVNKDVQKLSSNTKNK